MMASNYDIGPGAPAGAACMDVCFRICRCSIYSGLQTFGEGFKGVSRAERDRDGKGLLMRNR